MVVAGVDHELLETLDVAVQRGNDLVDGVVLELELGLDALDGLVVLDGLEVADDERHERLGDVLVDA